MLLTEEVKEILTLKAGRALDRRLAKALKWKCDTCRGSLDACDHMPQWSTNLDAAFELRVQMSALGWASEDDFTDRGWGGIDTAIRSGSRSGKTSSGSRPMPARPTG